MASSGTSQTGNEAYKAVDGILTFSGVVPRAGWDAAGSPDNWLVLDLKTPTAVNGFAIIAAGDTTHDPRDCVLLVELSSCPFLLFSSSSGLLI